VSVEFADSAVSVDVSLLAAGPPHNVAVQESVLAGLGDIEGVAFASLTVGRGQPAQPGFLRYSLPNKREPEDDSTQYWVLLRSFFEAEDAILDSFQPVPTAVLDSGEVVAAVPVWAFQQFDSSYFNAQVIIARLRPDNLPDPFADDREPDGTKQGSPTAVERASEASNSADFKDYEFYIENKPYTAPGCQLSPIRYPLGDEGTPGSPYGNRKREGKTENHKGVDIKVREGTPVYAALDGVVDIVGQHSQWGNFVRLVHKGRKGYRRYSLYAHLKSTHLTHEPTPIKAGDLIGLSGNTGKSTGPHLHIEYFEMPKKQPKTREEINRSRIFYDPELCIQTTLSVVITADNGGGGACVASFVGLNRCQINAKPGTGQATMRATGYRKGHAFYKLLPGESGPYFYPQCKKGGFAVGEVVTCKVVLR
jgi:murein DD-endopeptidase MepM/ murein hydrolase activator NlpD